MINYFCREHSKFNY